MYGKKIESNHHCQWNRPYRLAYNTCGDGAKETSLVLLMLSNIKFELLLGQASISMMSNIKFDAYMLHCKRKSSRRSLF